MSDIRGRAWAYLGPSFHVKRGPESVPEHLASRDDGRDIVCRDPMEGCPSRLTCRRRMNRPLAARRYPLRGSNWALYVAPKRPGLPGQLLDTEKGTRFT